jgi:NADPH-dependent curcumin reductase
MPEILNRKITLKARPHGWVTADCFAFEQEALGNPQPGEVLVRNHFVSLDPYQRGRMGESKSYAENLKIGDVIVAATVGRVIASASPKLPVDTMVSGYLGWQEYALAKDRAVQRIDVGLTPPSAYLGVLGLPGVTAWLGLHLIGQPKSGDTVVISAAAGAVGSVAAQLAKLRGASRVVGIAGGPAKCGLLVEEYGLDAALDYRSPKFEAELVAATPNGIDVYFENVGGSTADIVAKRLNKNARVPLCGLISQYNGDPEPFYGLAQILISRARVEGFICSDHLNLWPQAISEIGEHVRAGRVKYRETIAEGLDNLPEAFIGMLKGRNIGKQLVKLAA